MPRMLIELHVEMEGGSTHDVVADQRDIAKWEIQDFGCPFNDIDSRPMLAMRWMAWSAMTRQRLTELKWDEFDAQCVEAGDPEDLEAGMPDEGLDPGQTAPSA